MAALQVQRDSKDERKGHYDTLTFHFVRDVEINR